MAKTNKRAETPANLGFEANAVQPTIGTLVDDAVAAIMLAKDFGRAGREKRRLAKLKGLRELLQDEKHWGYCVPPSGDWRRLNETTSGRPVS